MRHLTALLVALILAAGFDPPFARADERFDRESEAGAQSPPASRVIDLEAGFLPDPHEVSVTAGGTANPRRLARDCVIPGRIPEQPTLSFTYAAESASLYVTARSRADTTLVVRSPDGSYHCNDDARSGPMRLLFTAGGNDPGVALTNPLSGRYDVWVGTFVVDQRPAATVSISERSDPNAEKPFPAPRNPETDAAFLEALRQARPGDPAHAEDMRRTQVQAEAHVAAGRLSEANTLYRVALERMPHWADGHYNRALVSAELGGYATAITEMRRYLYLAPNAPDARAAQDQVYLWEAELAARQSGSDQ